MSLKVPFELRRRAEPRAALAILIPSRDAGALLRFCARLALDPAGRVFDVAGALLLRLDEPTRRPLPGTIRLQALAENLLLPVDADLVPALLDDEVEGLTRDRGFIILPGAQALAFDPGRPLALTGLLTAQQRPSRQWEPLPRAWTPAPRIEEILGARPDETADDLLESVAEDIGTEPPPRPPEAGAGATLIGNATFGAGMGMGWLGKTLGLPGLAKLGASWLGKAVAQAPRLSEAVLGKQAAALRALLQDFREGNLERALRHALPLGEQAPARGAGPYKGDQLPPHGTSFSLRELLEGPGPGSGSIWYGGIDIMAELAQEYRKAAEEATRRDDFRRAAYIYGKLLRDYRSAANVLLRGGLHRQAALLLLAKLDDRPGAARAFEAAGEFDRAIQLFREVGDHESAAELLRRIGEEDAALDEYRRAADRLIGTTGGHLAAGELLLNKAGRPDLARELFLRGWATRPHGNSVRCGLRLAVLMAEAGEAQALFALVDQADEFFEPVGQDGDAGLFYNELAQLAGWPALASVRDELRDRVLLGLAVKLRQRAESRPTAPSVLDGLLTRSGEWPAGVVSDATFAVQALLKDPPPAPLVGSAGVRRERVSTGTVTAVCSAIVTGEVFLGFEGGDVFCFRPERAEVIRVGGYDMPSVSLATGPSGRSLVILRSIGVGAGLLTRCARQPDGSFRALHGSMVEGVDSPWLTPVLEEDAESHVGLWDGTSLTILDLNSFAVVGRLEPATADGPMTAAFLLRTTDTEQPIGSLFHDRRGWRVNTSPPLLDIEKADWTPELREDSPLRARCLAILREGPMSDRHTIVGLGRLGTLYWTDLGHPRGGSPRFETRSPATPTGGFLAATLLPTGHAVGVSRSSVTWYRRGGTKPEAIEKTSASVPSAVACFPSQPTQELIVVCRDGFIARVAYPPALAS